LDAAHCGRHPDFFFDNLDKKAQRLFFRVGA
jgi:hypothetical protein